MIEVLVWVFEGDGCQEILGTVSGTNIVIMRLARPDVTLRRSHRARSSAKVEKYLLTSTKTDEDDGAVMVMPPTVLRIPGPTARMNSHELGEWVERELVPVVEARMAVFA